MFNRQGLTDEQVAVLKCMEELTETARLALDELNDQDTGWYYQLKNVQAKAARALQSLSNASR